MKAAAPFVAAQALIARGDEMRGAMVRGILPEEEARVTPLAAQLPGRAGWELRLVVQGGLRIVDKIRAQGYTTLQTRPALGKSDMLVMLARSVVM